MPSRYVYNKFIRKILQIDDTPESIALGTAIGVFIAMTPTVGIQMVLALIFCTLFRANRLAGVVMVYISNPFTMVPLYWLDYVIGAKILAMETVTRPSFDTAFAGFVVQFQNFEVWAAFKSLVAVNLELALPTLVGGGLVGLVCAITVYPLTLRGVHAGQRRRAHKQALLRLREIRRREREEEAQRARDAKNPSAERKVG